MSLFVLILMLPQFPLPKIGTEPPTSLSDEAGLLKKAIFPEDIFLDYTEKSLFLFLDYL